MNQGLYRLVFSKIHCAMVVVSEIVSSRCGDGRSRTRRARRTAGICLALSMLPGPWMVMSAWADLPAGINIRDSVTPAGVIRDAAQVNVANIISSSANHLNLQQLVPRAIINYNQFNLDKGQSFNVDMQAGWSLLNRVHSVDPSYINGNVTGAGNIYFINANGVIIGKDAVFNVGSLYAGTLNIADDLFKAGFINDAGYNSVFELVDTVSLPNAQATHIQNAEVRVEGGAQINTSKNGKVMLFAPNVEVEKGAVIKTPDGQTILAAGKKIYLKSSQDPAGMLVEVAAGGTATNLGQIIADRGNITMMGLAVNQMGKLSATTSVRANGSIKLVAQDDVTVTNGLPSINRNGIITLGTGSVTEVKPEVGDKEETLASLAFKTSDISMAASLVNIDGKVSAKGGNISISSEVDASASLNSAVAQRIYLGEHATLDVSGVDAVAPISRFQLTIQLNSDALKDNPILRGSNLFGKTVFVDARKGTSLFNLQPYIDSTRMATVAEKMTNAGTVTLSNPNEIVMAKGATINVSGGSTTYSEGSLKESQLVYNGKLVPISQAQVGVAYAGIGDTTTITDPKWGSTLTYTLGNLSYKAQQFFEGGNAGAVRMITPVNNGFVEKLVIDGTLLGTTKVSQQQILQQHIPLGASLTASALNLNWVKTAQNLLPGFDFADTLNGGANYVSQIGTDFLAQGFNNIDFANVQNLSINSALRIDPNGTLTLSRVGSTTLQINQDITAAGAKLNLNAGQTVINDGVTISVAGRFDNNKVGVPGALSRPTAANAGSIQAGIVNLGQGVTLDTSAGAYVDSSGVLHTGQAGNIGFTTNSQLPKNLTLRAYGFDKGGELNLQFGQGQATNLYIGAGAVTPNVNNFSLDNAFFSQGGFSKYHLGAFNIDIGAENSAQTSLVYGVAQNLQMNSGFTTAANADNIFGLARLTRLPDYLRQAVSLEFATFRVNDDLGVLNVHENAHIMTDIGGTIQLHAGKQVNVLGDLTAHGGNINLSINDFDTALPEDASQMVFIGDQAKLDVSGSAIALPTSRAGFVQNKIVDGGTIRFNYIKSKPTDVQTENIKGAVVVKQGAILDVSGTSTTTNTLTNRGYVAETLYGAAGELSLYGFGSLLVDGTLSGHALGTGRGGSLNMVFEGIPYDGGVFTNESGRFWVTNDQQVLTGNLQVGDALKNLNDPLTLATGQLQRAQISAAQIESGGFDNVHLGSYFRNPADGNNRMMLAADLDLSIAGNLRLDTPVLHVVDNGTAQLTAGHLQLVSRRFDVDPTIATGTGALTLNANQIYLDGLVATSGVDRTTLRAQRDIHGQGNNTLVMGQATATEAGLSSNGELNLIARQIYPDSGAALTFTATGANSQINVVSSGLASTNVLSAGGVMTLKADHIVQQGVLKAPFGQIHLVGAQSLELANGSLTTVSGNGQNVPYGTTGSAGEVFNPISGVSQKPVEKAITIDAPDTKLRSGATLDLSGGGELFAYEWIQGGVGGTKDILAQPNTYALIPTMASEYAAVDRQYTSTSAGVDVGQSIYITGVAGIPSGTYTLLPARYALVPGAFIVQRSDAALVRGQTSAMQDGSMLTTGYLADMNTGAKDAQWSTFRVIDGSVLRPPAGAVSKAPSQYVVTNASSFFADPLNTNGAIVKNTQDAGKLTLSAGKLTLDASVVANKITGADGLVVDISANNIRVVNQLDGSDQNSLQLLASNLNALNADSILLGGIRNLINGATMITTVANSVSIENDASHSLKAIEFLATAVDHINMAAGAVIDTGNKSTKPRTLALNSSGDGAFLGLSSLSQLQYTRSGASLNAAAGSLNIDANAELIAGNSLVLDGSQNVSFAGNITLADGANVTLGSNRILIGDVPAGTTGLKVNDQTLDQLDNVANLTLNSYSTVDTYGDVSFGNDKLNLTINAAGIAGHLAAGESAAPANQTVTLHTKSFTLKNTADASYIPVADPSGRTLQINAESVRLEGDPNAVLVNNTVASLDRNTIGGYDGLQINAKTLTVAQRGALDLNVNQTQLNVGRINTESSANYTLATTGVLTTSQGDVSDLAANTNIGGALSLQADRLEVNSRIEALAGQINLQGNSQLHLGSQAVVSAASTSKAYADKTVYIDAGKVQLKSSGNIVVDNGAIVNVSSKGDADAGKVSLSATTGQVQLQGQLDGRALGTGKGGSLEMDVRSLASVSTVDQQAIGFSQSRNYRVRTGSVDIDGTGAQSLTARQVTVTADQGAINVSGTINANSDKQGSISLYAHDDLTLQSSAKLTANSSKIDADGGKIVLATSNGALNLNQGSTIQVAGGSNDLGGSVHLRAPRIGAGSGNSVAVTSLQTDITGARSTVLEAFRVYDNITTITTGTGTGVGGTLGYSTLATDVSGFMANQANILAALGKTGDSSFHLRAGQEIRSNSSLAVGATNADWNLYSASRAGGEPGVLTLRAANNLNINGSLSDGFAGTTATAEIGVGGDSWSYRLIAGADVVSANVMNTLPVSTDANGNSLTGNILLANNKLIRTGTGDIDIAAGGDLRMGNNTSVIYTAGTKAVDLPDFEVPDTTAMYLTNGGDINVNVRGNVTGAETNTRQVINQWLFRQAGNESQRDASWWIKVDEFKQSLAALGGGNVSVISGGDISNFSVSVPTTAQYDNFGTSPTGDSVINGGGDLYISAGKNIFSGVYFIGKGEGIIKAGESIATKSSTKAMVLGLMDGSFDVSANKDIKIDGTINPTLLPQSTKNAPATDSSDFNSYFNTYAETAAVKITALNGNVDYASQTANIVNNSTDLRNNGRGGTSFNPGTLEILAQNGAITLGEAYLLPSSQGNLTLLSANDISIGKLLMSDANASNIPGISNPVTSTILNSDRLLLASDRPYFNTHANSILHATDFDSSMIVSAVGNVKSNSATLPGLIYIPEKTEIVAGRDITNLNIALQNNRSSDVSVISAGRDVNMRNVMIAGPGELLVEAGRNVDLIYPDVTVIQATGNTGTNNPIFQFTPAYRANTALPSTGSSISILAGMGPGASIQAYIDRYIAPNGTGPQVLVGVTDELAKYREQTATLLQKFMQKLTGDNTLDKADAYAKFSAESDAVKTVFVNRHLTTELLNSAAGFAKAGNHERGYNALSTLYPTKYAGDILLFNSKISTNSGGSIDLITPGGLINVGVPGQGGDDIGVITEKGGEIRAIADGDFSVNQSKVITQYGSDIAIWSTNGTIDAGRGSKTATSIPERIVQTDVFGNTTIEVRGVAAGSGIRAQTYDPDGPNGDDKAPDKGTVYLTAPRVDAGEAGIEAGNLFLVAPVVLNVGNIQVQGTSSGVPVAASTSLAGVSTGLSPDSVNAAAQAVAQNVANSAATSTLAKPVLPSIISVDVIGIGR